MKTAPMSREHEIALARSRQIDPLSTGASLEDYASMGIRLPGPEVASPPPPPSPRPGRRSRRRSSRRGNRGRVYALFACKGGVGATTVAVNLAQALARTTPRGTVIVDLDLQLGDVLCAMNLQSSINRATISDLLGEIDDLHGAALRRRLAHVHGTYVLSQGNAIDQLGGIKADEIGSLLDGLAKHFDAVVVDGLRDFGDIAMSALDSASHVMLVTAQNVPTIRSAARAADLFRQLGYSDSRLSLVVNRYQRRGPLSLEAIEETLQLPLAAILPNDFRSVERALNHGVSLAECAPRARITRELEAFAARLDPALEDVALVHLEGWLARLRRAVRRAGFWPRFREAKP